MTRSTAAWSAVLAGFLLLAAGCRQPVHVLTVQEMAAALRAHGVAFTVEETAALPRVQAQGLRLAGKGLEVNVYRIDDAGQMKVASTAAQMAQAASAQTAGVKPLTATVRGPFLVIVRSEPAAGQVAAALDQVLPEQAGAPAPGAAS